MPAYNLMERESRNRLRRDRQAELDAVLNGTWPRDLNDRMRWTTGRPETAKACCEAEIQYLNGVEQRIAAKDPDLAAWEA